MKRMLPILPFLILVCSLPSTATPIVQPVEPPAATPGELIAVDTPRPSEFAGLLVYESSSSFMQAGRVFCTSTPFLGDGLYFDLTENGAYVPPNHATRIPASETIYLHLRRDGNTYTFSYSLDGQTWTMAGEHLSSIKPLFVGLMAGQSESGSLPAVFDYFEWSIQTQDA